MKTAISIPDDVFDRAEREAQRLGMSRSQLYVTALRRFLEEYESSRITKQLDEVYESDRLDQAESEFMLSAAQTVFARNEW